MPVRKRYGNNIQSSDMEKIKQQRVISMDRVFNDRFIDAKTLFIHHFNALPSMRYRYQIDGEKAFEAFTQKYNHWIIRSHQYHWFDPAKKKFRFGKGIVILDNHCLVEFDASYSMVLYSNAKSVFLDELDQQISSYREKQKRKPREMNLVIRKSSEYELQSMEIKNVKLDLGLFYEDDFIETDALIRKRLNKKKDKGIVLLHGLPGTGKTSYLRYLISRIKKRILFISPAVAGGLLNPDFVQLLIDNPDSVLIIEDAENIIMDRKLDAGSAVSNLLNISDGLLADCLNVQLICTFNSPLTMIDSALLRKGRLIAKYEFGALGIAKSQKLSDHLGFKTRITRPMTVAEIAGQNEKTQIPQTIEVMGFRRHYLEN
jgi:hypothetical protein